MLVESAADAVSALLQATRQSGSEAHPALFAFIEAGGMEITVGLLGSVPAEDITICAPVVSILAAAVADEHVLRNVAGTARVDSMIDAICERRSLMNVLRFVSDEKTVVRHNASLVLGLISKKCVPGLVEQMLIVQAGIGHAAMAKARVQQQEAVRALSLMAQDVSCFEAIIESGAVQALLDLLTSSEALQQPATGALAQLSSHEACVRLVIDSEAIPVLVELLSAADPVVQDNTMRTLSQVAKHSEACADLICDAGGLAPLVQLLSVKEERNVVAQTLAHFSKAALASALASMPSPQLSSPSPLGLSQSRGSEHDAVNPGMGLDSAVQMFSPTMEISASNKPRSSSRGRHASPLPVSDGARGGRRGLGGQTGQAPPSPSAGQERQLGAGEEQGEEEEDVGVKFFDEGFHDLQAIHDYTPEDQRMLNLTAGEIVRVIGEADGWLYAINSAGFEGYVPPTYLGTPDGSPDSDTAERTFFDATEEGSGAWTTERKEGEASWLEGLQENFEYRTAQQGSMPTQQHHAPAVSKHRGGSYVEVRKESREEAKTESNGVRQTPMLDD